MPIGDSFSFRQKPSGLFKWFLEAPTYLFRWRLGVLFGDRFLLLTHIGRTSGRTYHTALEVVHHDDVTGEYVVCSGTGANADWYRNITARPAVSIQVRNDVWTPHQRLLDAEESANVFAAYEAAHPKTAQRLLRSMGQSYDGSDDDRVRMMGNIPMVAFRPTGTVPHAERRGSCE
jgi:deazaflavin-dependent oxidoreductase (nitroreductase family)